MKFLSEKNNNILEDIRSRSDTYKGNIVDRKFSFNEIDIKWITTTDSRVSKCKPFIIFEHNYKLYFGIGDYEFSTLETYHEWSYEPNETHLNLWEPEESDYEYLLKKSNFIFYEFDHEKTIIDEDEFCDFELNIIKESYKIYKRDSLIDEIIKKDSN